MASAFRVSLESSSPEEPLILLATSPTRVRNALDMERKEHCANANALYQFTEARVHHGEK